MTERNMNVQVPGTRRCGSPIHACFLLCVGITPVCIVPVLVGCEGLGILMREFVVYVRDDTWLNQHFVMQ